MHAYILVPKVGGDFSTPFYHSWGHITINISDQILFQKIEFRKSAFWDGGGISGFATDKKKWSFGFQIASKAFPCTQ